MASSVHSRTAEMVASFYSMNKAYLSLPDRVESVVGFIAMMIDHYNMLDISNSDGVLLKNMRDPSIPNNNLDQTIS